MGIMRKVLLVFFILLLVFSLGTLGFIIYQYMSSSAQYKDISSKVLNSELLEAQANSATNYDPLKAYIDWNALLEINPDTVAWVYIPDSNVNYPIVQASDNEKYLHAPYADAIQGLVYHGAPFLDMNNAPDFTDDNNIVYAHNMQDGSMFADVTKFQNQEYYDSHAEIYVYTPNMNYLYVPFSVNQVPATYALTAENFASYTDMVEFGSDKLSFSKVADADALSQIENTSQFLSLVTCVDSLDLDERVVVFSALEESFAPAHNPEAASGANSDIGKLAAADAIIEPIAESSVS